MNYPDIGFTPEYARLFERTRFGGELCAYGSYLFYKRPILNTPYFDITSPYGYAGALNISKEWFNNFNDWCISENVVSEFARLHPFIGNHRYLDYECVFNSGEVYYVDLTQPLKFDKGCLSSIKKAQKVIQVTTSMHVRDFQRLYNLTMDRNNATREYYFSPGFFIELMSLNAVMYSALLDERVVSSIIILYHGEYAHYFLAGSDERYRQLNPSNLLLSEAINQAKKDGFKIFNLGGGKDDSHSSFKRSFSRLSKPFYVYKKIHNQEVYDKLSAGIETDYFPKYRSVK